MYNNNEIIDCKTFYSVGFDELTRSKLEKIGDGLKLWHENKFSPENDEVGFDNNDREADYFYGYLFSYSKMNKVFPKRPDYKFDFDKEIYR